MTQGEHLRTERFDVALDAIIGDRSSQQDAAAISRANLFPIGDGEDVVLCLADGMGGHSGGEIAARTAVNVAISRFQERDGAIAERLKGACLDANEALTAEKAEREESLAGMGCTLILAAVSRDRVWWCSIGDSLLLQVRGDAIRRLNDDHSMAPVLEALVKSGDMSEEAAAIDHRRNQLRSALTGHPIELIDISEEGADLDAGDTLLLASDGVLALPLGEIARIVQSAGSLGEMNADLLATVRSAQAEGLDNTTLISARMRKKEKRGWWPFRS